jgi:hypothetical protein
VFVVDKAGVSASEAVMKSTGEGDGSFGLCRGLCREVRVLGGRAVKA